MLRILGFQRWRIIHESKGYNERRETMNRVILSLKNIDKTYGKEQFYIIFPLILSKGKYVVLSVKMVQERQP